MSNYIVSARKYRPQRFDEVVGQEHITMTLKNAMANDHLAHAFLFCGPRGVGKTTSARILAKVLNCDDRTEDNEACDKCSSCTSFAESASLNIIELDAASNNSVEDIRNLIEQVRFQPQQGKYKIFIIDEVHMLSTAAFNAFLKTLEEPPEYAKFILATTEKHKIIPTILSRCQIFDFKRISIKDAVKHLEEICKIEDIKAESEALHIIGQKADGALRDALSIFDRVVGFSQGEITYDKVIDNLNVLDYDYYFKLVDFLIVEDLAQTIILFDEIMQKGFDQEQFLQGYSQHLRDLIMCKNKGTIDLMEVGEGIKERYDIQAKKVSTGYLLTLLHIANDCDTNYAMATHKRMHVELALMKMAMAFTAKSIQVIPLDEQKKNYTPELKADKLPQANVKQQSPALETKKDSKKDEPKAKSVKANIAPSTSGPSNTQAKPSSSPILSFAAMQKAAMIAAEVKVEKTPFELSTLKGYWEKMIQETQLPTLISILKSALKTLHIDDKLLTIEVENNYSQNLLQSEDLLIKTREWFNDYDLKINYKVLIPTESKDNTPKKILTDKDKFEIMAQKNASLYTLSKRFELSLDYT